MPLRAARTLIRTLDGLHLAGTIVTPDGAPEHAVVLVHGGGVTREEGGFFTRLAAGLGEAGVASLRFDLRGHGESEGHYKKRTIDSRPYWSDDYLDDKVTQQLTAQRYIAFTPSFKHGRALLKEVFWIKTHLALGEITAPTLIMHGTRDTFVPIESSRAAVSQFQVEHKLVEIEGAQHGFAVHEDPQYLNPRAKSGKPS